jgi:hypothetical protein
MDITSRPMARHLRLGAGLKGRDDVHPLAEGRLAEGARIGAT